MSFIIKCDGADCPRGDYDSTMYSISKEAQKIIDIYDSGIEHLCIKCFVEINKYLDLSLKIDEDKEEIFTKEKLQCQNKKTE